MSEVWAAAAAGLVVSAGSALMAPKAKSGGAVGYQNVDPTAVQKSTIQGDMDTFGDASTLASRTGTSMAHDAVNLRNVTQPGYSALAEALSKHATDMAKDPYAIPQSVTDQLSQYAAENNIGEGTGASSGFSGSNMLRSLGINALQYGQSNMAAATSALSILSGTAPNVSPVSPLSFMLSPKDALSTTTNNNTENQAISQGAANSAAAAGNANSANLFDTVSSGVTPALTSYLRGLGTPSTTPGSNAGYDTQAQMTAGGAPDALAVRSCWVAREVYGADNPEWEQFRSAMIEKMPKEFVEFYNTHGPEIAETIKTQPNVKKFLRGLMDQIKK